MPTQLSDRARGALTAVIKRPQKRLEADRGGHTHCNRGLRQKSFLRLHIILGRFVCESPFSFLAGRNSRRRTRFAPMRLQESEPGWRVRTPAHAENDHAGSLIGAAKQAMGFICTSSQVTTSIPMINFSFLFVMLYCFPPRPREEHWSSLPKSRQSSSRQPGRIGSVPKARKWPKNGPSVMVVRFQPCGLAFN